jgi:hypothetical protein
MSLRLVSTDEMVPLLPMLAFPTGKTGLTAKQISSASWSLAAGIRFKMLVVLLPSIVTFVSIRCPQKKKKDTRIKEMRFLSFN